MNAWTSSEVLTFLEIYQSEPSIWNPQHIQHKNRQAVSDAWLRMSNLLNRPVEELKTKKESLMITFRKYLKKKQDSIRSGAGSQDIYEPIWFAYKEMEKFLLPVYSPRETINTHSTLEQMRSTVVDVSNTRETPRHNRKRKRTSESLVSEEDYNGAFLTVLDILKNKEMGAEKENREKKIENSKNDFLRHYTDELYCRLSRLSVEGYSECIRAMDQVVTNRMLYENQKRVQISKTAAPPQAASSSSTPSTSGTTKKSSIIQEAYAMTDYDD